MTLRVLVGCEFSGIVRDAFASRGHFAMSCDFFPSERGPVLPTAHHYMGDVRDILQQDWDIGIFHPPCTRLAVSGARYFEKYRAEQEKALEFVRELMGAPILRICIENPVSVISTRIRRPDQIIQPWQFGHGETKATCLWLINLPLLIPTQIVSGRTPRVHYAAPSPDRWRERSRTYTGIADAMADQWGELG